MIWTVVAVVMIGAIALAIAYASWRSQYLETARQVEATTKRASIAIGQAAVAATRSAVDAASHLAEAHRQSRIPLRWCGPNEVLRLGEFTIRCPLTYATQVDGPVDEPSLIDTRLPVSPARSSAQGLPYWPSYRQMTPGQRRTYLTWMAGVRASMPTEIGYAFVFFYGLERRVLVDVQDLTLVVAEVLRLREVHACGGQFSWSFEQYTSSLLWYLIAACPAHFEESTVRRLMESTRSWKEEHLNAALAWFACTRRPLPDWAALLVAEALPQSQRSVVTRRVEDEFHQLFRKRYRQQFGDGLVVRAAEVRGSYTHKPASAVIAPCRAEGLNPLGVPGQFKPLAQLWNGAVDDLRRLSGVVVREGDDELSAAAWEAMPADLRSGIDHPLTVPMCRLVEQRAEAGGHTIVGADDLARVVGVECRPRFTAAQSRRMCEVAEFVGYGIEPDARLSGRSYRSEDQLAVFLRVSDVKPGRQRYGAASCMLRLGLGVAAADGEIHPEEVALLSKEIERMFDLNEEEQRRLEALRALLIRQGPDLTGLSQLASSLSRLERQALGRLLIALAAEDGVVTREEIRAVRKCYKMIGLDGEEADAALASLREIASRADDEPVTVRPGRAGRAGEKLPAPHHDESEFQLNTAAIRAIMAETREVAGMLAEAMGVSTEAGSVAVFEDQALHAQRDATPAAAIDAEAPQEVSAASRSLSEPCAALMALLTTRQQWPLPEAQEHARRLGLMLNGAVELINEWSVEQHGAALIYEQDGSLCVESSLLA